MDALHIVDTLHVNRIVWIRSLPEDECGPSRRMFEDLAAMALAGGIEVEEITVQSREEMCAALDELANSARNGLRPILHFDCHGSADDGLIMANGDALNWEHLSDKLRNINVETHNNLVCVFATCFGLHLGKTLRLSKPVPWYLMIAPEGEVTIEVLQDKTRPFYEAVQVSGNITDAFTRTFAPQLKLFNCQGLFARSLTRYIVRYGSAKALAERTERLVTQSLNARGPSGNRHELRKERRRIKAELKPNQALIDKMAASFLIGRAAGISYPELQRLVEAERRRRQR